MLTRLFLSVSMLSLLGLGFWENAAADVYTYKGETPGTLTAIGNAGSDQVFTFKQWHFAALEMPDNDPTQLSAQIEIDVTSVATDWKDLEKSVKKKRDYFFIKKFPKATVNITGATLTEDGQYTTDALLTLKGIEKPVRLTFEISDTPPYTVNGKGVIERRIFNFYGDGPKDEVPIAFSCTLP